MNFVAWESPFPSPKKEGDVLWPGNFCLQKAGSQSRQKDRYNVGVPSPQMLPFHSRASVRVLAWRGHPH